MHGGFYIIAKIENEFKNVGGNFYIDICKKKSQKLLENKWLVWSNKLQSTYWDEMFMRYWNFSEISFLLSIQIDDKFI